MNQNTNPGELDGDPFQPEPDPFGNLPDLLAAIYREMGLPEAAARKAALADLQCELGSLALAA